MRLAFVDFSGWDYTPDTPYQRPLGGSHSAMCYLAEALAATGHQVWLLNNVSVPTLSRGVMVERLDARGLAAAADADAVIVLNGCHTERALGLRGAVGDGPLMVYWTQHAEDQPASANLADPVMRGLWDVFVLISNWQAERYRAVFGLPSDRITVLRNAIGPAFMNAFPQRQPVRANRPWPPVLAYTSTPFRGLSVLIDAFPKIRAAIPGTTLKVFSSMAVYQIDRDQDSFGDLYRRCRETEGVEHVGSLPQPELARELSRVTCLAYPNTFAETSCIAAMEALAAGCLVVTSALGALPETLGEHGFTMPVHPDPAVHADAFATMVIKVLRLVESDPERAESYLSDQVERVNATTTWPARARQWGAWLGELIAARRAERSGMTTTTAPWPTPSATSGLGAERTPLGGGLAIHGGPDGPRVVDETRPAATDRGGVDLQDAMTARARVIATLTRPGDTVVEIGAGTGAVTLPLARHVGAGGMVVAIEPDAGRFAHLCANAILNGAPWVRPLMGWTGAGWERALTSMSACRLMMIDLGRGAEAATDETMALTTVSQALDAWRPLVLCRVAHQGAFDTLMALAARWECRAHWLGLPDLETGRITPHALLSPIRSLIAIAAPEITDFDEGARLFPNR